MVMSSYGHLKVNDGIRPDASVGPGISTSFSVGLGCSQNAIRTIGGGARSKAYFSKVFNRIAPMANPIRNAKFFVSEYAGCDEASMVRSRALALARVKLSISNEEFRFRLPSTYEVRIRLPAGSSSSSSGSGASTSVNVEALDGFQAGKYVQQKFPGCVVLDVYKLE